MSAPSAETEVIGDQLGRLARNSATYGLGQALSQFVSFLLLPIFTSYLSPQDYGVISTVGIIVLIATPVFSLGIGAAMGICYFDRADSKQKAATVWTALLVLSISASALAVAALTLAEPLSLLAFRAGGHERVITLFLLSTSFSVLATPLMLYLQFQEKALTFVVLTAISTTVSVGSSLYLVVVEGRGVDGFAEGRLLGQVVTFSLFALTVLPRVRCTTSWQVAKDLLRYGIPLVPAFGFIFVLQHFNIYILQWFDGLDAVGVYTIGFNLGLAMNLLVNAFTTAWYPFFMKYVERRDEAAALFGRVLTYYVLGFGTLSLGFFLAARPAILLMTQPSFHDAYTVVGLCATAQFLIGFHAVLLPGIYFAKEVRWIGPLQAVAAALAIGLNLVFIPALGFHGAALAVPLGFLALVGLQHAWNRHRDYLRVRYEWRRIFKFALVYAVVSAVYSTPREIGLGMEIALTMCGGVAVVATVLFMLTAAEREQARELISRIAKRIG